MARVIIFSREFPAYHTKAGQPTFFVEKFMDSIDGMNLDGDKLSDECIDYFDIEYSALNEWSKHHTVRKGNRWKTGDMFSPRVWSGKPYRSKQIKICEDVEIKKVWDFEIKGTPEDMLPWIYVDGKKVSNDILINIALNDGLELNDFLSWFKYPVEPFKGQIICWNKNIEY